MLDPVSFLNSTWSLALFGTLGFQELLIILIIALVLFGGRRIPEIMGGFGEGIKNFKKAMRAGEEEDSRKSKSIEDEKTNEDKKTKVS